jgi:uncharacterized protein with FMN-binding domain
MQRIFNYYCLILLATGIVLSLAGCQIAPLMGTPVVSEGIKDGVYKGEYRKGFNHAVVKVTIADGRITDVELVKHFASWIGNDANTVIPERMVEQQSTRVDAISGATNSCRVIMNAAQLAIEKAYQ